jgi:hypothetical protein
VKGHCAGARPFAEGLRFDRFRQREGLRPRRELSLPIGEHSRTQKVAR